MFIPFKKVKKTEFEEISDEKLIKFLEEHEIIPIAYKNVNACYVRCRELEKLIKEYKSEG